MSTQKIAKTSKEQAHIAPGCCNKLNETYGKDCFVFDSDDLTILLDRAKYWNTSSLPPSFYARIGAIIEVYFLVHANKQTEAQEGEPMTVGNVMAALIQVPNKEKHLAVQTLNNGSASIYQIAPDNLAGTIDLKIDYLEFENVYTD